LSHYADSHRGIALGFDYEIEDESTDLLEVKYDPKRLFVNVLGFFDASTKEQLKVIKLLLSSKAPSWRYEREFRVLPHFDFCEAEGGQYFKEIPDDFLKEVVLGVRCPIQEEYIKRIIKDESIQIKRATRSNEKYEIET
jgi:hypothetical protein